MHGSGDVSASFTCPSKGAASPVRGIDLAVVLHPEAGGLDGKADLDLSGGHQDLDLPLPDAVHISDVRDDRDRPVAYQRTDNGHLLVPASAASRISVRWTSQLNDPKLWLTYISPASTILGGLAAWYPGAQQSGIPVKVTVTAPADQSVQVSARPESLVHNPNGTVTTVWSTTQGEPGVSLTAGHYEERTRSVPGSGTRAATYALSEHAREADAMETELVSIVAFYEKLLGPAKDGQIAVVDVPEIPGTSAKGMAGLVAMASTNFTHPPRKAWPHGVDVQLLAHETAHTWFGSLTSAGAHPFFSESMAQYLSYRYLEAKYPELATLQWDLDDQMYRQDVQQHGDHGLADTRYGDPGYFETLYYKGPLVLRLLEREAGRDAMDEVLRGLLRDFSYQVPTVDRFEQLLEQASGKDLRATFDRYVRGAGTLP